MSNEQKKMQSDPWRTHEHSEREAWLKLSYAERLRWLWQAKVFAARALDAAKARAR